MKTFISIIFVMLFAAFFGLGEKKKNAGDSISNEKQVMDSSITVGHVSQVLNVKGILSEDSIPNFSWYNEQGEEVNIESYKGKVIIINFWTTWCAPCRAELPGFINIYNKYRSQDVEILGVSLDFNFDTDGLAEFIADWDINYQIVLDDRNLNQAFGGFNGVPTTFIIGKDFKAKRKHVGYINEADLEKIIQAEL